MSAIIRVYSTPLTITNGNSTSSPLPLRGQYPFAVAVPTGIQGTRLGFQVRESASDPFRPVSGPDGLLTVPLVAGAYVALPRDILMSLAHLHELRLVTLDNSGNAVNQTSTISIRTYTTTF